MPGLPITLPRTFARQSEIQVVTGPSQTQPAKPHASLVQSCLSSPSSNAASLIDNDSDDSESEYEYEMESSSLDPSIDVPGELLRVQLDAICKAAEGATEPALIALHNKCQEEEILIAIAGVRTIPENGDIIEDLKLCFLWTCDRIIASTACPPAVRKDTKTKVQTFLNCIASEFVRILEIVSAHDWSTPFIDRPCADDACLKTLMRVLMEYYLRRLEERIEFLDQNSTVPKKDQPTMVHGEDIVGDQELTEGDKDVFIPGFDLLQLPLFHAGAWMEEPESHSLLREVFRFFKLPSRHPTSRLASFIIGIPSRLVRTHR